ncbi:MAG: recombinase family protein [Alphaproteobacteria bacterium]
MVDPVRAPIIQRIYQEYATGLHTVKSVWCLAKDLGLYTRMKKKKGCLVTRNTIYEVLTNPFYYGEMCIKGKIMPHIYTPLVSKDLFDKVQKILMQNGNHNRANVKEGTKTVYTFRKMIYCKECGCLITPEKKIKKSGREYVYLRCTHAGKICPKGVVNEEVIIEQLKREVFSKLTLPVSLQEALKKQLLKNLNETSQVNAAFKANITSKLNDLKVKENNLLDFYLEGKLPQSTYETKKPRLIKREKH